MSSRRVSRRILLGGGTAAVVLLGTCALTYVMLGPAVSCWQADRGPLSAGLSTRTLLSGGEERCYLLYIPASMDLRSPSPLVLSLHGFASRPEGQIFLSRWNEVADREGFVVAYPQGTKFPVRWNSFPASDLAAADDVQFLRDLVGEISRLSAIDPLRVYLSGMSNGGAMTHLAACEMAEVFAAAGVVAGPAMDPPGGCNPSRAISVIGFYGTADPLVSYEGGELMDRVPQGAAPPASAVRYLGAVEWAASWARRNECNPQPETVFAQGDTAGVSYPSCRDEAEVILYTVEGGGHAWPGGRSIPFLGKTTQDIHASETMWAFFEKHAMQALP